MPPAESRYPAPRKLLVFSMFSLFVLALLFITPSFVRYINSPLSTFPIQEQIVIPEGSTESEIVTMLSDRGFVRSELYLHYVLQESYPRDYPKAGVYEFDHPLTTREIADALVNGAYRAPHLIVTFPEGFKIQDFEKYVPDTIPPIDSTEAVSNQGYYFPDTYFIDIDTTGEELLTQLRENYETKIAPLREKILASPFSEAEVITLASLVEREAKDYDSKRRVAGILIERLRIDMPLQVDATFDYLFEKESHELTSDDLEIDSPYNTYTNRGLPPTPIANPGLESIMAVLDPEETPYLYYLTGSDGTFHYAKNFEEHKRNKERYLK